MKDTVQTVMWVAIDTDKAITLQQCRQGGGSVAITSVGAVVLDGGITAHGNVSISSGGGALSLTPMKAGLMQPPAVLPSPRPMAPSGRLTAASRCLPPVSGKALAVSGGKDVYIEVKSGNVLLDATAAGTLDIRASHVMNGKVSAPTLVLASDKGIGSAGDYLSLSYAGGSLVTASITGADGSIYLDSGAADMRLVRVSAPGTVDLTTRGALLDANDVQTVDERDMERLKGMWDRLNILASDDPAVYEQQVMRQVDSQCGQLTTAYHSYFALQTAINAQGGRDAYLGMLAGDASYGFRQNPDGLSDSELDALALERAAAWLDATIADWEKQLNSLRPFWPTRTMRPCALTARPSTLSG